MKINRHRLSVRGMLAGAAFSFLGTAFADAPPARLVSFVPAVYSVIRSDDAPEDDEICIDGLIEEQEQEAVLYSPPSDADLKRLENELELLVFTVKEKGVCRACDAVRETWRELGDRYPITPVYCSMSTKPRTRGDVVARNYDVEVYPTFILVRRNLDGTADIVDRWGGSGTFFESTERRIKRAFAEARWIPPRGGVKKLPKNRPIPGLNPPRVKPSKPPREIMPGRRPGAARVSFEINFDDYDFE